MATTRLRSDGAERCAVCFERVRSSSLFACNHPICIECFPRVAACPSCRMDKDGRTAVHQALFNFFNEGHLLAKQLAWAATSADGVGCTGVGGKQAAIAVDACGTPAISLLPLTPRAFVPWPNEDYGRYAKLANGLLSDEPVADEETRALVQRARDEFAYDEPNPRAFVNAQLSDARRDPEDEVALELFLTTRHMLVRRLYNEVMSML